MPYFLVCCRLPLDDLSRKFYPTYFLNTGTISQSQASSCSSHQAVFNSSNSRYPVAAPDFGTSKKLFHRSASYLQFIYNISSFSIATSSPFCALLESAELVDSSFLLWTPQFPLAILKYCFNLSVSVSHHDFPIFHCILYMFYLFLHKISKLLYNSLLLFRNKLF